MRIVTCRVDACDVAPLHPDHMIGFSSIDRASQLSWKNVLAQLFTRRPRMRTMQEVVGARFKAGAIKVAFERLTDVTTLETAILWSAYYSAETGFV